MEIKKVGVVGCGLMGHGIVQVAAQAGLDVVALETEQRFLDSGLGRIKKSLDKLAAKAVEKGRASQEDATANAQATYGRIRGSLDRADLADCDPGGRGHRRGSGRQEGALRRPGLDLQARDDLRLEHVLVPDR